MSMVIKKAKLSEIVGKNIARLRHEQGLSQEQMAEQVGIDSPSMSRVEKGLISPRFKRLERMAEILNCAVSDFFHAPHDGTQARANSIAQMLEPFPPKKQEEALHLIRRWLAFAQHDAEDVDTNIK